MMMMRVPPLIANSLLVIVSTVFCYVAMEYAIFRVVLPTIPLDIRPQLPSIADVLTQNSKAAYLPHDYVALLGDSYAEGLGDWLLETSGDRTKPFHSADVIHQITGRDVVSFGKGGAGSAEGIVLRLARVFPSSPCSVFPAIDPPRQIFVYFYEGNDIQDNIDFTDKVSSRYGRLDAEAIDRFLVEQYAATSPWACHLELSDTTIRMAQFLYEYYVVGVSVRPYCGASTPHANRIVVGDRTIDVPTLEGPALWVSDDGIRLGMGVLARSLSWLRKRFDGAPISVIYVPSPLATYHHAGDAVSYCLGPNMSDSGLTTLLERRHDLMRDLVAKISADQGVDFADATPALRAAASVGMIHGPRDWNHLNETGYRVLGSLVSSQVQTGAPAKRSGAVNLSVQDRP